MDLASTYVIDFEIAGLGRSAEITVFVIMSAAVAQTVPFK